ncbi:MAG: hypothetical protein MJ107_00830 [Lachnospiraceae bacterium]|nr:hypothetical protein [Lachnospiraceae bacterium]
MKTKMDLLWGLSLLVVGVMALVMAVANLIGFDLPDTVVRFIGVLILIAIPVLAFTTVKKYKK